MSSELNIALTNDGDFLAGAVDGPGIERLHVIDRREIVGSQKMAP